MSKLNTNCYCWKLHLITFCSIISLSFWFSINIHISTNITHIPHNVKRKKKCKKRLNVYRMHETHTKIIIRFRVILQWYSIWKIWIIITINKIMSSYKCFKFTAAYDFHLKLLKIEKILTVENSKISLKNIYFKFLLKWNKLI